jgi:hypothetical protein
MLGATEMVRPFVAKELKMMPATCVLAEIPTELNVLARSNVAVSDASFGTVAGVQSVVVSQSEPKSFHVAVPAKVLLGADNKISRVTAARKQLGPETRSAPGDAPGRN